MVDGSIKHRLTALVKEAASACIAEGLLKLENLPPVEMEMTKEAAHGDYATNLAMILASSARMSPRKIAEMITGHLRDERNILEKSEIAGPGFINFFVREQVWAEELKDIERLGKSYGSADAGRGRKIQVEFVSANPTGPLHIGHARGAVVGDVIANILAMSGYDIFREYYINDAGNQMNNLGKSVWYRYLELLGKSVEFPGTCYQGDYIRDIAGDILKKDGDLYLAKDEGETIRAFTDYAAGIILEGIKEDLKEFGIVFDRYFSERVLYVNDGVARLLAELEEKGFIYREEETLWFKTKDFGDDKDRVVVRKNGEPTYFAADIAYHKNKYERGFDTVIDIWGADHHGYIPRMHAGIQALGHSREALRVVLVQLVNLLRDGKPVAMSTRSGEFVTMREVVEEVGRDAARYNFLMRRSDSHLDFDLEVAKRQSNENPVYYVQYAHARICSILRMAQDRGIEMPASGEVDPQLLSIPEEIALIKALIRFPEVVEGSARTLEPHRITFYLNDLAGLFHSYYNKYKVISEDEAVTKARLFLMKCIAIVLRNALTLLGVSAPEKM
ncbi:MAG: arginine--tRNA ligase [Syntrophus sp. (in: bacteria)]|nr:arginine--tRNA ligase [Syntrophus sp. (in: bacteria)]